MLSERTRHARDLFSGLSASYDRMGAILSFGQDPRWRRFLVGRVPPQTAIVLDVAAGTGLVTRELLWTKRAERVLALDQSDPMLREAVRAGGRTGGGSARFVVGKAERLPFADSAFGALTFAYLLRYVDDPAATLRELVRVVPVGGVVAGLEFAVPRQPLRSAWWLYTRLLMPAIGRLVSRPWFNVGRFLGPSIDDFWARHPLETQLGWWRAAGVSSVRWRRMSLGGAIVMWGVRDR